MSPDRHERRCQLLDVKVGVTPSAGSLALHSGHVTAAMLLVVIKIIVVIGIPGFYCRFSFMRSTR